MKTEEWYVAIVGPMGGRRYALNSYPWVTDVRAGAARSPNRDTATLLRDRLKTQDPERRLRIVHVTVKE